jgi:ElaB/YqjD/DUF883 family membrane-anchored ribosome-binding protein
MNDIADRRPEEIQAEIERTRGDLNQTLSAIENRLNPSVLFDQGVDYLRRSGAREYVVNLGAAARQDPLPLALVGVGLAWLMMSGRDGSRVDRVRVGSPGPSIDEVRTGVRDTVAGVRDSVSGAVSGVKDVVASVRDKVSSVRDSASRTSQKISDTKQRIGQTAQAARDKAGQVGSVAREQADRVRSGFDRLLNEQPLALGAVGLAVGAVLAATAPRTRQEDRLMGDASDRLKDDVRQAGEEQLDRVQSALGAAGSASGGNSGSTTGSGIGSGRSSGDSGERPDIDLDAPSRPPPAVVTSLPPGPR